ncbi:MAG: hypothetical protein Q6366_006665 [Candidatus Freyarchaeota archaeon]
MLETYAGTPPSYFPSSVSELEWLPETPNNASEVGIAYDLLNDICLVVSEPLLRPRNA